MKINSVHSGAFNSKFVFATLSLLLVATLTLLPIASAATPEPNYGTATVDGDPVEWDTSTSGPDFFADMIQAGGQGGQTTVLGHLFLRYDISTNTLYVLALTTDGSRSMIKDSDGTETFVNINDLKVVSSASASFAWVDDNSTHAVGFEASFTLMPGTYDLYVHTNVYQGGESQTSATLRTGIPLTVVPEPATIIAFASIAAATGLFAVYKRRSKKA